MTPLEREAPFHAGPTWTLFDYLDTGLEPAIEWGAYDPTAFWQANIAWVYDAGSVAAYVADCSKCPTPIDILLANVPSGLGAPGLHWGAGYRSDGYLPVMGGYSGGGWGYGGGSHREDSDNEDGDTIVVGNELTWFQYVTILETHTTHTEDCGHVCLTCCVDCGPIDVSEVPLPASATLLIVPVVFWLVWRFTR